MNSVEYIVLMNCIRQGNLNLVALSFTALNPVKTLSKLRNANFHRTPIGFTEFDPVEVGNSFIREFLGRCKGIVSAYICSY